jgi:RND family efflux transporter MFP subunit
LLIDAGPPRADFADRAFSDIVEYSRVAQLSDDLAGLKIEREPERRGRAGRWIGLLIVLVVLGAGGLYAWRWFSAERPVEVEVATVNQRAAGVRAQVLQGNGYVTARRRATVSSKITGKVVEVNVEEGMAVKEGQVLARLDDSTFKASLALAEAQAGAARRAVKENEVRLAEAKLTQNRMAALLKEGVVGQAELDTARAQTDSIAARILALNEQITVAERQTDLARTDLDNTVIRAPFSGVAISKDAQPGEMVSPVSAGGGFTRTGICTIVDMRSIEVEVDVNENYINRVRPEQDVVVILNAYPEWEIPAHVITTVPTADRQKATVLVRIGFKKLDPRILPDMGVKVNFLREEGDQTTPAARPVTLVPKAAVKTDNNQTVVFVVAGETVERRAVKVGGADGDRLEVLAGLSPGDRVVVSPPATLVSGAMVRVK